MTDPDGQHSLALAQRGPDFLTAALSVTAVGLPVFPCGTNKAPAIQGGGGFHDATADEATIHQWGEQYPAALVGVPTGTKTGLLVVDIDPKGHSWMQENWQALGCNRFHRTRRGFHLLFACPTPAPGSNAGQVAAGVDIRCDGGYIIWWPAHGGTVNA